MGLQSLTFETMFLTYCLPYNHLVVNYQPGINEHTEAVFPNSNPLFIQFISKFLTTQCINQTRAINMSLVMENTLGNRGKDCN